jgi:hypothetical protein
MVHWWVLVHCGAFTLQGYLLKIPYNGTDLTYRTVSLRDKKPVVGYGNSSPILFHYFVLKPKLQNNGIPRHI